MKRILKFIAALFRRADPPCVKCGGAKDAHLDLNLYCDTDRDVRYSPRS